MGAMKELLADFNNTVDSAWDEAENIRESLYNLNLPYESYILMLNNVDSILNDISELQVDVKNQLDLYDKLDYTE